MYVAASALQEPPVHPSRSSRVAVTGNLRAHAAWISCSGCAALLLDPFFAASFLSALKPSDTACLASSPGITMRTTSESVVLSAASTPSAQWRSLWSASYSALSTT